MRAAQFETNTDRFVAILLIHWTLIVAKTILLQMNPSKPTAMKEDNELIRRRKTKSAKSSDSSDGGDSATSDVIPFIEDTLDDECQCPCRSGVDDDPFIGLADSDASMLMPDIDSSGESAEEEEEESVAYGDTKDGATTDQWIFTGMMASLQHTNSVPMIGEYSIVLQL